LKKIFLYILVFLMMGCSTFQRVDDLDERFTALEESALMEEAAGVGAATKMYGRDCVDGSCAAGKDLDDAMGMSDGDVAMIPKDPTYGFLIYEYDDPSSTGDDPPWVIDPDSGTGEWLLRDTTWENMLGKMDISNETGDPITVNDYDTGTYFANQDNDAIEFNLPALPTDLVYCFGNSHVTGTPIAKPITLDPDASDYIILDGTAAAAGQIIGSDGDGKDNICVVGLDSSYWKVTGYQGTWTEGYCSDFNPGDPTDEFCDDADGDQTIETGTDDYDTAQNSSDTWDGATVDTGAYIKEVNHSGTLACKDRGSKESAFLAYDLGGTNTTFYGQAYVNIVDFSDLVDGNYVGIYRFNSGASARTAWVTVTYITDTLYFRVCYAYTVGQSECNTGPTVTQNTWYRIGLKYIAATDAETGVIMYVDGTPYEGDNLKTTENWWIDEVYVGPQDDDTLISDDAIRFQVDRLGFDDDTALEACP
jgi:hypothetical protein